MAEFTENQIEIISHSLGVEIKSILKNKAKTKRVLPADFYRNRFVTTVGSKHSDEDTLLELESLGLMKRGKINRGEMWCWYLTQEGIEEFRNHFNKLVAEKNNH